MSDKPIFMRPIEWQPTAEDFSITHAFTTNGYILTGGVYAAFPVFLQNMVKQCSSLHVALNDDFKVVLTYGSSSSFEISFTNHTLATYLGFRSFSYGPGTSFTAEDTPLFTWIPTYVRSDQNLFQKRIDDAINASEGLSGAVSCISNASAVYSISASFPFNAALSTFRWLAFKLYKAAAAQATDYQRTCEYFVEESLARTWPDTSTNPSPAGFWYWYDRSTITTGLATNQFANMGWAIANPEMTDPIDDVAMFCSFDAKSAFKADSALPRGTTHYNIDLKFHTMPVTIWNATSTVP